MTQDTGKQGGVEALERFADDVTGVYSRIIICHQLRASAEIQDSQTKAKTGWADTSDRAELMRKASAVIERIAARPAAPPLPSVVEGETAKGKAIAAMRAYVESAGVPIAEFDPEFVVRMMSAMMVSFHKYGRVSEAYPLKFSAADDVRARMSKYRTTGNKHYLVDAANFAMIEAMHPGRAAEWGGNAAADSPGRTTASGHRLVQEANDGSRIMGETILDIPGDAS